MKVLHINIGESWAGVASYLFSLLPELQKEGVDVYCILFGRTRLNEMLLKAGIKVIHFERKRKIDFDVIKKIRKIITRESINVVHMHGYMAILYGLLASVFYPNIKRVVTFHQPSQSYKSLNELIFKYSIKTAYTLAKYLGSYFISVSKDVEASYIKAYKLSEKKVKVIYNGFDLNANQILKDKSNFKKRLKIPNEFKVISIIGRLTEIKGHKYFLEAAKKVLEGNREVLFLIIGEGELKNTLVHQVEHLKLNNNVRLLGFREDILDILNITDIIIIASLYEGVPYTLLEAMSLGTGIIATHVGGLPEIIDHKENGLLVKSRSSSEIARAINLLISDDTLYRTLSQNAKEKVTEHLSTKKMARETLNFYKQIEKNN